MEVLALCFIESFRDLNLSERDSLTGNILVTSKALLMSTAKMPFVCVHRTGKVKVNLGFIYVSLSKKLVSNL